MKFKSIFIALSFVASCASHQELTHTVYDLVKIEKLVVSNKNKEPHFLEGLALFCREQSIPADIAIGAITHGYSNEQSYKDRDEEIYTTSLHFFHPCFPKYALLTQIERIYYKKTYCGLGCRAILNRTITMTPEMKKFIQDMIEKGKSVSQTQTIN